MSSARISAPASTTSRAFSNVGVIKTVSYTHLLLRGAALTEFLLSKTGYKWDAVPVDGVKVEDLDKESFDIFRREALRSGRMTEEDLNMSNEQLLDNLGLLEQGKLKRCLLYTSRCV